MAAEAVSPKSNAHASRTRQALYEAAAELFVERGYEDTTMADIAERAGASRRTAFNHFPSKGDIPMLWVRQMADRALETVTHPPTDDIPERIHTYFRLMSQAVETTPKLSRQMMLGWIAARGPARFESQLLEDVTPLLKDGQACGQIDPATDVVFAARALCDVFQGAVFRWVRQPESTLHQNVDGVIVLVLSAIKSRS
jgi:AcrR family transcriptional regulator